MGRDPVQSRAETRRPRPGRFAAAVPVLCLIACTPGCDDEQYQTVAALQEQNRVLREQVKTLERELSERQADRQAGETVTASALREANVELQKRLAAAESDKQAALTDTQPAIGPRSPSSRARPPRSGWSWAPHSASG